MNLVLVKNYIDKRTDDILNEVEQFACIPGISDVFGADSNSKLIGRSQLSSLLNNCKNASSVSELKLYISYKEAKDKDSNKKDKKEEKDRKGWNKKCGENTVAEHLINSITNLIQVAEQIKLEINKDKNVDENEKITEEDFKNLYLKVVEKFLGYLYWKGTVLIGGNN